MARSFYLYRRGRFYYAEILSPSGARLFSRSTEKENRDDAAVVAAGWVRDGVPGKAGLVSLPVAASAADVVESVLAATLTPESAEKIVRNLLDRGLIAGQFAKAGPGSSLLESFLVDFWNYETSPYVREKLAHGQRIGARHCYESMNRVKMYWIPAFKGRRLGELTRADLKAFSLSLSDRGLSAGSINKILLVGTTAFSWAHREGLLPADPSDGLIRFSGEVKKRGVLTPEEAAELFTLPWNDERVRIANLTAMTTGLRAGEVLAIRRSDIGEVVLYVRHSWSHHDRLKAPKNGETRRVPLLPEVRAALLDLLNQNPHHDADTFVF